jgi:broad specificity phosphatase PhoE
LPIAFDPALREIHCGVLDGAVLAEVQTRHPELWSRNLAQSDESFGWPGGETYGEFRSRVLDSMRHIASLHPASRVLIVTHAGVISQVLGASAGLSAARWEAFRPANASVTEVLWRGRTGSIVRFNDCAHLADCQPRNASTCGLGG